jgi:hypothetical protein
MNSSDLVVDDQKSGVNTPISEILKKWSGKDIINTPIAELIESENPVANDSGAGTSAATGGGFSSLSFPQKMISVSITGVLILVILYSIYTVFLKSDTVQSTIDVVKKVTGGAN